MEETTDHWQWLRRGRVLRHRNVRRYFAGYLPSQIGTAMTSVALAFAVLDSGGTAADLGYVLTAAIVPQVVLMIGGGVIADRIGRRRVMLSADLLRTVSQGLLAALLLAGHPPIWAFAALAATVGIGDAFFSPAFSGLIVDIAPTDEIGDANALFGMASSTAEIAGPALAGVVIAVANPATAIAVDAVSYAISAVALAGLTIPARSDTETGSSIIDDLIEGWGEFRSRTWLWTVTVQFALYNLIARGPFLVLGPVLCNQDLNGARSWGIIIAAQGAGAVLGGLAALGRRPGRPVLLATFGSLLLCAPLALFAVSAPTAAVAAAAFISGLGSAMFNIFFMVAIQQQIPVDTQARVAAFTLVGAYSAGPITFAAAGPIATLVGAHLVMGIGAGWTILSSLAIAALPATRTVHWRTSRTDNATAPNPTPQESSNPTDKTQ